ncbi:hypothetical protein HC928_07500, partial [bacterium]|nr:hypothetical protein [bacterium]
HATLLTDQQANDATGYYFDEPHLLWGWWLERDDESAAGFFLLREGQRGIQHAPPAFAKEKQRARLVVRHYLVEDDATGLLYVGASRLVKLEAGAAQ